jgi:hypothetical protein
MPVTPGPPNFYKAVTYQQSNFYSSSVRDDGQTVMMHAQVHYGDLLDFERTMKGFCFFSDLLVHRYPPTPHYQRWWLWAKQVDYVRELSEPDADVQGNLTYTDLLPSGRRDVSGNGLVEVAVTYEMPDGGMQFAPDSERPITDPQFGILRQDELWRNVGRRIENEVTSQQLPRLTVVFSANASPAVKDVPAPGAVVLATATLYYTVVWPVKSPSTLPLMCGNLEAHLAAGVGTINSVPFDGKYPPYTLLALAPKRELVLQVDGSWAVRMTYVFAQRGTVDVSGTDFDTATPDWTRILNGSPDTATAYSRINRVGAPTKFVYATSDFTQLFTP